MTGLDQMRRSAFEWATLEGSSGLGCAEELALCRELFQGQVPWEVEVGFGKGRFLLERARREPEARFLGIEVAGEYFRLVYRRLIGRKLANVLLLRADALVSLAAVLPSGFARAVHIYFPDPWPKARHGTRRLIQPTTIDLLLRPLQPGGWLYFATDFLAYGQEVQQLFSSHPGCRVYEVVAWPEGPRTNYEAKYACEGRKILRLAVELRMPASPHPSGLADLLVAYPEAPFQGATAVEKVAS